MLRVPRQAMWPYIFGCGLLLAAAGCGELIAGDDSMYLDPGPAISADLSESGQGRHYHERMAAWQMTLVATDEQVPNSCIDTYVNDRYAFVQTYELAKIIPALEIDGKRLSPTAATQLDVQDVPGGVIAHFTLGDVRVTTEIYPLLRAHDTLAWEGAAWYSISTEPPRPVGVQCGGGHVHDLFQRASCLRTEQFAAQGCTASLAGETGRLARRLSTTFSAA